MRICASRACGQDHGCSSETAPRATRSSALSGHTCVMGREAAVPQIGGLVPPRETGGRALLPRGSRPARPARIPPHQCLDPAPRWDPHGCLYGMRRCSSRFITRLLENLSRTHPDPRIETCGRPPFPRSAASFPLVRRAAGLSSPEAPDPPDRREYPPHQCLDPAPRWDPHGCLYGMRRRPFRFITRLLENLRRSFGYRPQTPPEAPSREPGHRLGVRGEGGFPGRFAREWRSRVMRGALMRLFP